MTEKLNYNSNSFVSIYEIDLAHPLPDQELKDYFVMQLDNIVDREYKRGYELKSITTFDSGKWMLVFSPQKPF